MFRKREGLQCKSFFEARKKDCNAKPPEKSGQVDSLGARPNKSIIKMQILTENSNHHELIPLKQYW